MPRSSVRSMCTTSPAGRSSEKFVKTQLPGRAADLLQLVRSFQLLSSFGHEAIAMPWTWAVQCQYRR